MDALYTDNRNCRYCGSCSFFVFVCDFGITGVFLAVLVDEASRAVINFCKYLRIVKNWKKA